MHDQVTSCVSYEPNSYELVLPSPIIFTNLCVSTDKTSLFISSFVRLMFYLILYYVISDIIDIDEHYLIKYILLTSITVNIIYIGIVVSKSTLFSIGEQRSMFDKTYYDTRLSITQNIN
jgi:hypothetical protein